MPKWIPYLFAVVFLAIVGVDRAQQPEHPQPSPAPGTAKPLSFDVASIKLRHGEITFSADPSVRGRTVEATASTLTDLITYAYSVRYEQVAGAPGWAGSEHYDIVAKADGEGILADAQSRQMYQILLADRFRLKVHRESQEVAVYALIVGKNGPKLAAAAPDAAGGFSVTGRPSGELHLEAKKTTMEGLARQLSNTAGRPVLDRTGLTGFYAFTLDWIPATSTPLSAMETPSMFTAVQEQLGLRLQSSKGMIEKLVVDGAERPSEN